MAQETKEQQQTLISSRGIPLDGAIGSFSACKPLTCKAIAHAKDHLK